MNKILVRALSGAVYVALIVFCTLAGGWYFFAMTVLFTCLGIHEYQNLIAHCQGNAAPWAIRALDMASALLAVCTAGVTAYTFDNTGDIILYNTLTSAGSGLMLLILCLMARLAASLRLQNGDAVSSCAASLTGFLYVAVPMSLLCFLGMLSNTGIPGFELTFVPGIFTNAVLTMFILIWVNDTGAFCFGCTLGKHRLCERLSPKKSWEGFWGGFACCVAAGALLAGWADMGDWWAGALFGACVSVLSTWGDLFESQLKRTAGVKDSGNLIPGHGGILDRIDSLLFVAPVSFVLLLVFNLI